MTHFHNTSSVIHHGGLIFQHLTFYLLQNEYAHFLVSIIVYLYLKQMRKLRKYITKWQIRTEINSSLNHNDLLWITLFFD